MRALATAPVARRPASIANVSNAVIRPVFYFGDRRRIKELKTIL